LTPAPPDARRPASDRRPGLPLDQGPQNRRSAASTRSRVPLRRKRPAGTRGSGDIDEPSAVTERARSIGDHAASEIDAPGPRLTPTCGGRTRRPRTEEWPLPDDHPQSRCQLGALDPRSPITEEGLTTVPLPPPVCPTFFIVALRAGWTPQNAGFLLIYPNHRRQQKQVSASGRTADLPSGGFDRLVVTHMRCHGDGPGGAAAGGNHGRRCDRLFAPR
jgi:hypothetical protein